MFNQINTLIYALIPVIAAAALRPRMQDDKFSWNVVAFFVVMISTGFLVNNWFILYGVFFIFALRLAAKQAIGLKLPAFMPALPDNLLFTIPFPGLTQLITVGTAEFLGAMALPAVFKRREKVLTDWVGRAVIAFAVVTWLLDSRIDGSSLTNWLRLGVENLIGIVVPYFAVRNAFDDNKAFSAGMKGLLTAIVMLAALGFWGSYLSWDFFRSMPLSTEVYSSSALRDGSLRASATMVNTLFAFICLVGALILWVYRGSSRVKPLFYGWLLVLLLFAPFAASRGGMMGGFIAIGAFLLYCLPSRGLRRVLMAGIGVVLFLVMGSITTLDLSSFDPYGTFDYRQRLIEAALVKFQTAPLFGDANYPLDPFFEPLRQGQGIIDFVNTYIQMALGYGLAGLLPFLAVIVLSVRSVLKASDIIEADALGPDVHARAVGRALAGIITGYALMIFTISAVSYILPFLFVFCGMAMAYSRLARR